MKTEEQKRTNKTSISYSQYLQLMAMKELAKKYNTLLDEMVKSVQEITGELDYKGDAEFCGHDSDFLWGGRELDDMLKILKLKVLKK